MTRAATLLFGLLTVTVAAATQQTRDRPASPPGAGAPAGTGSISGVVADDRGQPMRRARVTVLSVDRAVGQTATTDDSGRFSVKQLPGGRYNVQATRRAWLDANYGATRPGRQGTIVALAEGQQLTGVRIAMTRGAVIAGTVRGENGDPVPNIGVMLFQFNTRGGVRSLGQSGTGTTDDLGAYRFWGLSPGDYIVMLAAPAGSFDRSSNVTTEIRQTMPGDVERAMQAARSGGAAGMPGAGTATEAARRGSPVNYAPVFYPGTTDASIAETLHLTAAEERSRVDLPLRLTPTVKVEGSIVSPPGVAIIDYQLRMFPFGDEFNGVGMLALTARPDTTGHFVIPSVAPGRYTISAAGAAAPGGPGGPGVPARQLAGFATEDVVVIDQDLNVSMQLQPPFSLKARMVFDGADPPKDAAGFEVSILSPINTGQMLPGSRTGPDTPLILRFPPLPPGKYSVFYTTPRSSPWVAVSAMTGGHDAFDAPLDVRGDIDDLVVTFTDHPSEIAGRLQDTAGRPATDYFVIVFPVDRSLWTPTTRRIQSARPGNDGAFTLKGLPAGDYLVGALTDVEPGEWFQPSFLEQVVPGSQKIAVAAGQKTVVTLKLAGGRPP